MSSRASIRSMSGLGRQEEGEGRGGEEEVQALASYCTQE